MGWAKCGSEIFNRETGLSQLKFVTEKEKVIGRRHPCQDQQTAQRNREVAIKLRVYTEIKGKKLDGWQHCCGLYGSSGGKAVKIPFSLARGAVGSVPESSSIVASNNRILKERL